MLPTVQSQTCPSSSAFKASVLFQSHVIFFSSLNTSGTAKASFSKYNSYDLSCEQSHATKKVPTFDRIYKMHFPHKKKTKKTPAAVILKGEISLAVAYVQLLCSGSPFWSC